MESKEKEAIELIRSLIDGQTAAPTAEEVVSLAQAFPYMALPAALRLRRGKGVAEDERARLVLRVAAMAPGRDTLFRLLDPDGDLLRSFIPPEEKAQPTAADTDSAIDTFLDTYGHMDAREEALLEKLIFNPVPDDYALLLESESRGADTGAPAADDAGGAADTPAAQSMRGDAQDRLLDAFLTGGRPAPSVQPGKPEKADRREKPEKPSVKPHAPAPSPASSLSESLAQVYIRRGRYDKAFDIIHALSLNNPKKSVYFADQLRFLQKLMLNERLKSGTSGERKQ